MAELPHSYESECSALSAILNGDSRMNEIINALDEEDFYGGKDAPNRIIFAAIKKISNSSKVVDVPSIVNEIDINQKKMDKVGGVVYLTELTNKYISGNSSLRQCYALKNLTVARKLIETMESSLDGFNNKSIDDIESYIAQVEKKVLDITKARKVGQFEKISDLATDFTEKLKLGKNNEVTKQYISTGFKNLDLVTRKWQPGQFNIIGARPSVGKTAFALTLAYNAAVDSGRTVAFFSLEMNKNQIVSRLLSSVAQVSSTLFDNGKLTNDDYLALDNAVDSFKRIKLLIDDTPGDSLGDIKTKAQQLKANNPDLGAIFIDYLGLINNNTRKNWDSKQNEVSDTSRQLKALARELDVPIICLSQLSRESEKRSNEDRMPRLTDIRDSGSIEQDADIVMFIHRPNYQNAKEDSKTQEDNLHNDNPFANAQDTKINVAKNRNGKTGIISFQMLMNIGKFVECDNAPEEPKE